jgi:hypothetical protein
MVAYNEKELMVRYLKRHYPVTRVKFKDRFKRGLVLDYNNVILLANREDFIQILKPLTDILIKVFGCHYQTARSIVKKYYMITTP